MSDPELWLAMASTAALIGVGCQVTLAIKDGIDSMESFLAAKNQLMEEERKRIRGDVSKWRVRKRRSMLRAVATDMNRALTDEELRIECRYDRQGYAWMFVLVGALIATVGSWLAVFSE